MKQLIAIFLAVGLIACTHQAPQRPSQRKGEAPEVDSAQLALLELNQRLAQAADQQLVSWVQQHPEQRFALYEANTWMNILYRGDDNMPALAYNEECTVHMRVMNLQEQLLEESEASYRIGKQELPPGVDVNIYELRHGARARILAPWYTAYGLKGTANIPPYENVIIEIELR